MIIYGYLNKIRIEGYIMKGYKALQYENGILRSKILLKNGRDIFEVGIPKQ